MELGISTDANIKHLLHGGLRKMENHSRRALSTDAKLSNGVMYHTRIRASCQFSAYFGPADSLFVRTQSVFIERPCTLNGNDLSNGCVLFTVQGNGNETQAFFSHCLGSVKKLCTAQKKQSEKDEVNDNGRVKEGLKVYLEYSVAYESIRICESCGTALFGTETAMNGQTRKRAMRYTSF